MTHKRPDEPKLRRLADLIAAIRPTWQLTAIDNVITAQLNKAGYWRLAHACIDAALDPSMQTPVGIVHKLQTAITSMPADRRPCPRCSRVHDPDQTACKRRDADSTARGAAAARDALKAAG